MPPQPSETVGGGASGCPRPFQRLKHLDGGLCFALADPAGSAQSRSRLNHRRTPELSLGLGKGLFAGLALVSLTALLGLAGSLDVSLR